MNSPRRARAVQVAAVATLSVAGLLGADTLVMRDGRRIEGHLVGVRGDTVEFESGRGRRSERYDRDEVRRIELDSRSDDGDYDGDPGWQEGGGGYGRPRGLRERTVTVNANTPWNDSGITLRRGQEVYFSASGKVHWGKDRNDGPEGESKSPHNPGRPIPDRPGAALIGRIDDGDAFFIGSDEGAIRVRDAGRLFLGVNDDYLQDNFGSFRVTVYY